MTSGEILEYHWDKFLSHLCEFYPLAHSFIERFEYELDWNSLSKNRTLDWSIDFLIKYETRFLWHELAWNESILWTEEKIERFKKRLDWYYLGRNVNLPISEEFIIKYSKKLFVIENNPLLTEALIQKYNLKVLPRSDFDTQEIKNVSQDEIENILTNYKFYHNQLAVYTTVFVPIINEKGLEPIFESKFDYSQRYYYLSPIQNDVHGLTPEFEIDGNNPFHVFTEGRSLLSINEVLILKNGSLQEGPDRLYEIPRFSSFSYYTTLLVSENVKEILEQFNLPLHKYHEVILKPKKITTDTKFYLLQLEFDTLNKDLEFTNNSFYYSFKDFKNSGQGLVTDKISSYIDLVRVNEELKKKYSPNGYGVKIIPERFILNSEYDMYSYSVHGHIIVNQYLKDVLEKNFPEQILFKSAQLLNIKIDQQKYDQKSSLMINTKISSKLRFKESDDYKYYYGKAERLENSNVDINIDSLNKDKFSKKEAELKVVFPKLFKDNYLNKRIKLEGYNLLSIPKFYIQNDFADRYPETFKSVVIAENGVGDSINLILERDSDYKLGNRLFEFFHETGEYEEI